MNRIAFFALALVGCGPAAVEVEGPETVTVHELNSVQLPSVAVKASGDKPYDGKVDLKWTVEPADIAQLDAAAGTVTPLKEGTATVTVAAGNLKDSFQLNVALPDQVAISGATDEQVLQVGNSLSLAAEITDNGTAIPGLPVTWTSSDAAIASVTDGQVQALAPGRATIKAEGGGQAAEIDLVIEGGMVATEGEADEAADPTAPKTGSDAM